MDPNPVWPQSNDRQYSPLWILYAVTNAGGVKVEPLTSEESILSSKEAGKVAVTRTAMVINCPIVGTERGELLPGIRLSH